MNAKQIADELENIYWIQGDGKGKPFQQYADFVRQQQAEIEALKSKTLTDGIDLLEKYADKLEDERPNKGLSDVVYECIAILRKAQEK